MTGIFGIPLTIDCLFTLMKTARRGRYFGVKESEQFIKAQESSEIVLSGCRGLVEFLSCPFWRLLVGLSFLDARILTGTSDTIPYFVLFVSCLRANYLVFPISPRNSPSAVAYLIDKVGVNYLLIGHEPTMQDLSANAIQILKNQYPGTAVPDVSYVPLFEDLFLPQSEGSLAPEDIPYEYHGPDAPAMVIHSSGECIPEVVTQ
jgi:hypothetical protein